MLRINRRMNMRLQLGQEIHLHLAAFLAQAFDFDIGLQDGFDE